MKHFKKKLLIGASIGGLVLAGSATADLLSSPALKLIAKQVSQAVDPAIEAFTNMKEIWNDAVSTSGSTDTAGDLFQLNGTVVTSGAYTAVTSTSNGIVTFTYTPTTTDTAVGKFFNGMTLKCQVHASSGGTAVPYSTFDATTTANGGMKITHVTCSLKGGTSTSSGGTEFMLKKDFLQDMTARIEDLSGTFRQV